MSAEITTAEELDALREVAATLIAAERQRQIDVEGYGRRHDEEHGSLRLLAAAASYMAGARLPNWPWDEGSWKPKGAVRNLVRAGALALAAQDVNKHSSWRGPVEAYEEAVQRLTLTLSEAAEVGRPTLSDDDLREEAARLRAGIYALAWDITPEMEAIADRGEWRALWVNLRTDLRARLSADDEKAGA